MEKDIFTVAIWGYIRISTKWLMSLICSGKGPFHKIKHTLFYKCHLLLRVVSCHGGSYE